MLDLDTLVSAAREARRLEREAYIELCKSGASIDSNHCTAVRWREALEQARETRRLARAELRRRIGEDLVGEDRR